MSAPYKAIVTVDFETRWDSKEYTLSKMTTEEYIRDKRFVSYTHLTLPTIYSV